MLKIIKSIPAILNLSKIIINLHTVSVTTYPTKAGDKNDAILPIANAIPIILPAKFGDISKAVILKPEFVADVNPTHNVSNTIAAILFCGIKPRIIRKMAGKHIPIVLNNFLCPSIVVNFSTNSAKRLINSVINIIKIYGIEEYKAF